MAPKDTAKKTPSAASAAAPSKEAKGQKTKASKLPVNKTPKHKKVIPEKPAENGHSSDEKKPKPKLHVPQIVT